MNEIRMGVRHIKEKWMSKSTTDVLIIGGGPAGIISSVSARNI